MSHSHIALNHLVNTIESPSGRRHKSVGPVWLSEFVDQIAEFFEPFVDMGRVGFECLPGDERWEIAMYLGQTESVGGQTDGDVRPVAFQFDLARLNTVFDQVDAFHWNAFPGGTMGAGATETERSFISVVGCYRDNPLRLRIHGTPPDDTRPGLREYPDGTWEAI